MDKTTLTLTPEMIAKASEFAKNSVATNADRYAGRNQFNVLKIEKDIMIGKLGEETVYQLLSPKFPDLENPDYQIYAPGDKSWSPDLLGKNYKLAVKSQDIMQSYSYGESFVFQNRVGSNYDVDKEIFGSNIDNNYVAFVLVNVPRKIATLRAIVKVSWLHEKNLFQPMRLARLQNNKQAVYFDQLEKFGNELWQLK